MRPFFENANRSDFTPALADYIEDVVLAADTLVRVPIPSGAQFVTFAFDDDIRVKAGVVATTLTLPAATSTDGSGSELNPAARRIPAFLSDGTTVPTHICLRAPAACTGSLSFYR